MTAPTATSRSAGDIAREARNARILELHAEGLSERQIAGEVNTSRSTVWSVVTKAREAAKQFGLS